MGKPSRVLLIVCLANVVAAACSSDDGVKLGTRFQQAGVGTAGT